MNASQQEEAWKFLLESLRETKTFVLEQAPDVLQQLITWKRVEYLVGFALATVLTAVLLRAAWVAGKRACRSDPHRFDEGQTCLAIFATSGSAVTVAWAIGCGYYGLMVWCAPKVFLLLYLASLVK